MKTIKLSVEQAKELYNTNKEFRTTILHEFTDSELGIGPLLRDWEDLDFSKSYCPMINGQINTGYVELFDKNKISRFYGSHLNVPSIKHAKSMVAFAKLSMLMTDLGDECNVDWSYATQKHIITRKGKYCIDLISNEYYEFLAFKTESIRDAFLEKHERLIKDYFMID